MVPSKSSQRRRLPSSTLVTYLLALVLLWASQMSWAATTLSPTRTPTLRPTPDPKDDPTVRSPGLLTQCMMTDFIPFARSVWNRECADHARRSLPQRSRLRKMDQFLWNPPEDRVWCFSIWLAKV